MLKYNPILKGKVEKLIQFQLVLYPEKGKVLNMEINKDMTIGELLEKAPEKAEILLEAGMHCLGCPASQAETIEEACEVHGIDVEELIKRLNS